MISKPTDLSCRHQAAWAYITVPARRGHSQVVEYRDRSDWVEAAKQGTEWLVPMYQTGTTGFRARYGRADQVSAWTNGQVWMPDGFTYDRDDDTVPRTPEPRVRQVSAHSVDLEWDDDPGATGWLVRRQPGHARHRPTADPQWRADGLEPGTDYEFGIIAENTDTETESDEAVIVVTTTGDDPTPPGMPGVPRQLRVHCIHPTHAKVEWDDNPVTDQVTHYQLEVTGPTSASAEVIGTLQEIHQLTPDSDYTVAVRACNTQGCSGPARTVFRTGVEEPPPEPDPPSGLPAPAGLVLNPVGPGEVEATWDRPVDARTWWIVSIDGVRWQRVTVPRARLQMVPGAAATVEVYAVVDRGSGAPTAVSAIARAGVVTQQKGA